MTARRLAPPDLEAAGATSALALAAELAGAVLLLVDDEPARSPALQEALTAAGLNVLFVSSGPQAKQQLLQRPIDLVLLTLRPAGTLTSMDSYELCRQIKLPPPTRNVPVVFLAPVAVENLASPRALAALPSAFDSADTDDVVSTGVGEPVDTRVRAFRSGAADFVSATGVFAELLARLEHHIRIGRRLRELEREKAGLVRELRELKRDKPGPPVPQLINPSDLPRGFILDGKYRLEERIGLGGFGVVYRATHLQLQREVALKIFRSIPSLSTEEVIARFRQEGASASRLSHPNAITILDSGIASGGIPYLAMELLIGRTLADELRERSPLPLSRCIQIIVPVCDVLIEAHASGIVHRDVKPDNVFLHRTRSGEVVKVLDFGIAKLLEGTSDPDAPMVTGGGAFVGTPTYMAPERLRQGPYDGRSDVYSVGVMLYQMLAGQPPFESAAQSYLEIVLGHLNQPPPPLRERRATVPEAVAELVMRTLEKDPQGRPTARQLLTELVRVVRKSVGQLDATGHAPLRSPGTAGAGSPSSASTSASSVPGAPAEAAPGGAPAGAAEARREPSSSSSQGGELVAERACSIPGDAAGGPVADGPSTRPQGPVRPQPMDPEEDSSTLSLPTAVTIEFEVPPSHRGPRR